jgi:putative transposase
MIIKLVKEAIKSGAHQRQASEEVGISARTLQRWCRKGAPEADQRSLAKHPTPVNKLTDKECKSILAVVNRFFP